MRARRARPRRARQRHVDGSWPDGHPSAAGGPGGIRKTRLRARVNAPEKLGAAGRMTEPVAIRESPAVNGEGLEGSPLVSVQGLEFDQCSRLNAGSEKPATYPDKT